MPLQNHFDPKLPRWRQWEPLHGMWPATIAQRLRRFLPANYVAVPQVHAGSAIEVDVAAFEKSSPRRPQAPNGSLPAWQPEAPSLALETELLDLDDYAVHVYDASEFERLVATVELISPANKDRPDHRESFVAKCAALIQQGVSVAMVDVVTTRRGSLYAELLRLLRREDSALGEEPLYAAELRRVGQHDRPPRLEIWARKLELGATLPTLPLWLTEDLAVPLELEASYLDACDVLQMP